MGDAQPTNATSLPPSSAAAFSMLHPGIQRRLWDMRWNELRWLQAEAIAVIMQGEDDLVLSAATASGKTEAAFLPILSKIADHPLGSVRALYVGPLKALINDQFSRVTDLCTHLGISVHGWHGDIAASKKAALVESPGGVLLITPESLESLFVNRSAHLTQLFSGLEFAVIDELHSFLDNERGLHLRSLLSRVRTLAAKQSPFRTVGLSATIGDPAAAQRYVNADHPKRVHFVSDPSGGRETKLRLHGYCERFGDESGADPQSTETSDELLRMAGDIVRHCRGHANLVFANSKADVEELADLCSTISREERLPDRYLVHHGSLSAEIREDAEATLKEGTIATVFCSSTLEMGIDIGSVAMVGQVDPPWSVASVKQRIGRSGRRSGEAQVLRMYLRSREPGPKDDIFDRLHLPLVQGIAVAELMLEGWTEPPRPPACDLSTLTQQIISIIAQYGGANALTLHQTLCVAGPFREIPPKVFAQLLRNLAEADVIEQMSGGDLILGLKGERLRRDKGFYAVFSTPSDYTVIHLGEVLGTLSTAPQIGECLLFAGRRWEVADVDHDRLELFVVPASGWKRPKFSGAGGEIHTRIREKMREVLLGSKQIVYLDETAVVMLQAARQAAVSAGLSSPFIALGPRRTALMTWAGTRTQRTLAAMSRHCGVQADDADVAIVAHLALSDMPGLMERVCKAQYDPEQLAREAINAGERALRRKYDWLLSRELLVKEFAAEAFDVAAATAVADRMKS